MCSLNNRENIHFDLLFTPHPNFDYETWIDNLHPLLIGYKSCNQCKTINKSNIVPIATCLLIFGAHMNNLVHYQIEAFRVRYVSHVGPLNHVDYGTLSVQRIMNTHSIPIQTHVFLISSLVVCQNQARLPYTYETISYPTQSTPMAKIFCGLGSAHIAATYF